MLRSAPSFQPCTDPLDIGTPTIRGDSAAGVRQKKNSSFDSEKSPNCVENGRNRLVQITAPGDVKSHHVDWFAGSVDETVGV